MSAMTRDEVLQMAIESGGILDHDGDEAVVSVSLGRDQLEACFRAVAEREREECEKLVVAIRNDWNDDDQILKAVAADYLAEAIRARGQR